LTPNLAGRSVSAVAAAVEARGVAGALDVAVTPERQLVLSPGTVVSADAKVIVPETRAKKSLVWIGSLLIALFVAGIVLTRTVGNTTTKITSSGTTKTTTKTFGSDTLLTALLATGAALIVVGLLYSRISVIKLPGGAEIALNPDEKKAVEAKVKEKVEQEQIPPEAAPMLTMEALDEARSQKLRRGVLTLTPDEVGQVVDATAARLT
jgi:hypothetical protein